MCQILKQQPHHHHQRIMKLQNRMLLLVGTVLYTDLIQFKLFYSSSQLRIKQ